MWVSKATEKVQISKPSLFCEDNVQMVAQERSWRQSLLDPHMALDSIPLGEVPPGLWQKASIESL